MFQKLLLLAFGTLIGFVLAEAAVRVHYYLTLPGQLSDLSREHHRLAPGEEVTLARLLRPSAHPGIVYELKPELDVRFIHGERIETNRQGWRGEEFVREASQDTIRVVGLGDSVMFGWGVEAGERYTDVLRGLLAEAYPERSWEVMTFAAPGYNLPIEVEVFSRYALDYGPDLVMYGFVANDHCLPNFLIETRGVFELRSFLLDRLQGQDLAPTGLVPEFRVVGDAERTRSCRSDSIQSEYRHLVGAESFDRSLLELHRMSAERGVPVVLVHHPTLPGLELTETPPEMIVVDIEPRLDSSEHRLANWDPHPNVAGHALIARLIFDDLERRGVWADLVSASH